MNTKITVLLSLCLTTSLSANNCPDFTTWADDIMHLLSGSRYDLADIDKDNNLTKSEWLAELTDEEEQYLVFEDADQDSDGFVTRSEADNYTRNYPNLKGWYDQWVLDQGC